MKIAIRLDDITSDMDWEKFDRMEVLLDNFGIAPLIGLVPNNQDDNLKRNPVNPEFPQRLQAWRDKNWVIAMHGWNHLYTTKKSGCFPLNHFSEYAGISKEQQKKMIQEGMEKLQQLGIQTNIFMAPAHSFDSNTLNVLKEAGFRYITDGFGNMPYNWKGLTFLPIAFQKNKDIKKPGGYTTLVFHTNTMNESDFERLESLLEEHKNDLMSYGEYLQVAPIEQTAFGRIKEYGMATGKWLLVRLYSLRNRN